MGMMLLGSPEIDFDLPHASALFLLLLFFAWLGQTRREMTLAKARHRPGSCGYVRMGS